MIDDKELSMWELLGLDAALQRIQVEFENGTTKLTELEKSITEFRMLKSRQGSKRSVLSI